FGTPLLPASSPRPAGSVEPGATAQVNGGVPPRSNTSRATMKGAPADASKTRPLGNGRSGADAPLGVTISVSPKLLTVYPAASVMIGTIVYVPIDCGVPVSSPSAASVRPAGSGLNCDSTNV